jgi:amino acid permease
MYMVVGVFGVLTFDDGTYGDILTNYAERGTWITHMIEAFFAFSVCMCVVSNTLAI